MRTEWQRVRDVFERAIEEQPADLDAWLAREAADSPDVRSEVRSLLDHHSRAGRFLTDDEFYNRIKRTADRLDKSVDQINLMIADINAGRGTLGKLLRDEQIYNDARAAIARFNTTTERIDNLVAAAQRGEGTVGKLLNDETLYTNVNQLSSEGVKMIYDFRQNPKKYLTIKFELF